MNPKQIYGDKKPPLSLVPLSALIAGTMAFYDGAGKYGKLNWRENPVEAMTYVEAILRHTLLFANGEDVARDSGVLNLGGVIASAGLLVDAQANGCMIDNRIKSQVNCDLLHEAEALLERLKAQHAERRAAQDHDEEARLAVEEGKRGMASEALTLHRTLVEAFTRSTSPREDYEIRQRIKAAEDLLLNMVNGVFPEYDFQVTAALHDIVQTTPFPEPHL